MKKRRKRRNRDDNRIGKRTKKVSFSIILKVLIPKIIKTDPLALFFTIFITALNAELIVLLAFKLMNFIEGIFLYDNYTITINALISILVKLSVIAVLFEIINVIKKLSWIKLEGKIYAKLIQEVNIRVCKLDGATLRESQSLQYINEAEEGMKKSLSLTLSLFLITIDFLTYSFLMSISLFGISKLLSILIIFIFAGKYIFTLIRGYSALKFERNLDVPEEDKEYYKNFIIEKDAFNETWFTGVTKYFIGLYNEAIERYNKVVLKNRFRKTFYIIVIKAVNVGFDLCILLAFMILFFKEKITFQCLVSFYLVLEVMFYSKERVLIKNIIDLFSNIEMIKDYIRFLDIPEREGEDIEVISSGEILFKNVYFTYPENEKSTLRDMWIKIEPNETVAIVGASEAEKLAIKRLITGVYRPTNGDIFIGGVNTKFTLKENIYKQISVISNNYDKDSISLYKDNIMSISKDNKELLEKLMRQAELSQESIDYLNGNINNLYVSDKELQKIALVRGLCKKHCILLLDNITSLLNNEEEKKFYDDFEEYINKSTCIIFSDNLRDTRLVDRIVVIDRGSILQVGNHNELVNKLGKYRDLYCSL